MAVTALVLGILSLALSVFTGLIPVIGQLLTVILGIVAIILGAAAIKRDQERKGLAIAGLIMGFMGIVLGLVFLFLWGIGISAIVNGVRGSRS